MITRINERRRPLSSLSDIADLSVTTAKLENSAVTEQKLNAALQTQLANFNTRLINLEPTTALLTASSLAIASGTATTITPFFTGRVVTRRITSNAIILLSGDQITSNVPFTSGILTVDTSFTLLTIDRHGDQDTSTITISAVQPPTALITATGNNTTLAYGASTTLTFQFTNAFRVTLNGNETLPNGQPITNGSTLPIVTPDAGTTQYTLVVTNSVGVSRQSILTLTVLDPPTVSLTVANGIINFVEGTPTSLIYGFTGGTATLQRSFNGTPVGQPVQIAVPGPSASISLPAGITRYTLVVTNAAAYSVSSFVEYTVTPPPRSGWYGDIIMQIVSFRPPGTTVGYNYTIYMGPTTADLILAGNRSITTNVGNGFPGTPQTNRIDIGQRLENNSSTFLVIVNREASNNGTLFTGGVGGGTIVSQTGFFTAIINPTVAPGVPITIGIQIFD